MRKIDFYSIRIPYYLLIFVFKASLCFSQNTIDGTVKDDHGNLLIGATVIAKKPNSSEILSYDITDLKGDFSITIASDSLNLILSVSYLGYKTVNKNIENKTQKTTIVLEESLEELREVLITSSNIEKKGDTLSYSVSAFKDQKDRSIADVLKKMPGIEVLPNGQINYMGEPIEKYYIEGMDMLEGRYNLANDNISADDVSKVQILENHQPVKVLDSLVFSDRTSLNIKLKNNTSITGTAEVGGGFSPVLFKTNITPLILTKKSQALISYQYNNTGDDLTKNTIDFSSSNTLVKEFGVSKQKLLSIQQLSRPPFASARWLNNNDHFGNINYLYRLNNNTDLKINLSYLNGVQVDKGEKRTIYITQNDTISYEENAMNMTFLNSLNSKFTIERNRSESYFRNTFSFKSFWDSQRGINDNDNSSVLQKLSNPYLILINELKVIKPIGKQLITFNSSTGYTKTEQELFVSPGQFENLLNEGQAYSSNKQRVGLSTFFSENTAGFTKKLGAFTMSALAGFGYKNQYLTSDLLKFFNGIQSETGNDYRNDLRLTNSNVFITNQLGFKQNNWTIVLKTPLYLRNFNIENRISNHQQTITRLNFEPDLQITKKLSPYWEAKINGTIENKFGEIDNLLDGYVLRNYLSLIRYNTILKEETRYFSAVNIKYRDVLKAIFAKLSFSIGTNDTNLLYNTSVADNGSLIIESIQRDNNSTTQSIDFYASKYFSKIKTSITADSRFSFSENPQIVNGILGSYKNKSQHYNLDFDSEITKWFSLSGSTNISFSKLNSSNNQFNKVKNWKNSIAASVYLNDHEFFNIDAEHYYNSIGNRNDNNYFLNLSYQFTFKKYNLDTEIVWNNVLNTRNYVSVYNDQFFRNENIYILRPSQFLISFKFSL